MIKVQETQTKLITSVILRSVASKPLVMLISVPHAYCSQISIIRAFLNNTRKMKRFCYQTSSFVITKNYFFLDESFFLTLFVEIFEFSYHEKVFDNLLGNLIENFQQINRFLSLFFDAWHVNETQQRNIEIIFWYFSSLYFFLLLISVRARVVSSVLSRDKISTELNGNVSNVVFFSFSSAFTNRCY